jgi:hypothetical protein
VVSGAFGVAAYELVPNVLVVGDWRSAMSDELLEGIQSIRDELDVAVQEMGVVPFWNAENQWIEGYRKLGLAKLTSISV